jgi:hypothetical protein
MTVATVGDMLNAAEDADIWAALTDGQGTYEESVTDAPEPTHGEDDDQEPSLAA